MSETSVKKTSSNKAIPLALCNAMKLAITQKSAIEEKELLLNSWVDECGQVDNCKKKE
jgi:hypothetical protein